MEELFTKFGEYIKNAEFNSFEFWIYPIGTILIIWLLTIIGLKLIPKGKSKLKTVFRIHKFWIINSLLVATVIIGLICYWWSSNYFAKTPIQLSLLISLFIALFIPIIIFITLRSFFTNEDIKEIAKQPKTFNGQEETITTARKSYRKIKVYYFMLLLGFLFLLFALNPGKNLISIVFDNSGSMRSNNSIDALSETFDNLNKNNEIVLTTLEGLGENMAGGKNTINEVLAVKDISQLQAGNVMRFTDPISAKSGLNQITYDIWGSPICESIWKSYLFIKNDLVNNQYKNRILIVITDGEDNITNSISSNKFFFDVEEFADCFQPENVFIIDFSADGMNPFLQKFEDAGCEIYDVTDTKQDYLDALDMTLNSFKNNWHLIYWMLIITVILTAIALLIEPKKIV